LRPYHHGQNPLALYGFSVGGPEKATLLDIPDIPNVLLTANSKTTLSSSSPSTRRSIAAAIEQLSEQAPNTERVPETGHYVSRVEDSRIVWTRAPGSNEVFVLTIFVPYR
jgi:hypothetical protein